MQNNTQSQMQGTIHTNLQVFIYIFIYIAGRPTQWVLCSYWSQVIMWTILLPLSLWFLEIKEPGVKSRERGIKYDGSGTIIQVCKEQRGRGGMWNFAC